MKMLVTMTKGKQVTIPAKVRKSQGITDASRFGMIARRGEIVIRPLGDELERVFRLSDNIKPRHKLSEKQMDELNERMFR